jgi:hypothetical protein
MSALLYFMFCEIKNALFSILEYITLCNVEFKSARPFPYIATVITANIQGQSLLR